MGHPSKIQLIRRKKGRQWYVNFPTALASALELNKGEVFEWTIKTPDTLELKRKTRKT